MAEDCPDGDYLGAYSRFFSEFVSRVNPYDQLPVSVSSYNVTEAEIVGEIINVTLQYLNQTQCPASLQAYLVHQVIQEIKSMCKKQPEDCGFKSQEKTYTSLKLMQAIINKVNEICTRYLDNSRLALLPPPPSTPLPQITAGGSKNCRRKMEDRYVILHDLHTTFGIEDDSIANYYAVFDGHAGQDAAVYCAAHLHQYLTESIYYPTDPERALRDAFLTTDRQFIEKSKTQKLCGGTTAVCTLILNKRLYVAWVGDSTAMLIKRDSVVQLVNPHRLHREDEVQRIRKAGGVVMPSMGTMRVNGVLGVSRAIGDVRYKPFVTGEPEVKSVPLDGTEDFLVLATDGLTDYLNPKEILTILYHEIQRNPNGFKRTYQILLHWAKQGGSEDNITVVVVLLTPANAIAARPLNAHPYFRLQVNDILEKMNSKDKPLFMDIDDAHNAINSNILKQSMISQESRDEDDGILAASNGKHENGDADYDYSDLGPETNVDAIDDVTMPVKNLSYEFYKDDDICHEDGRTDNDSNILDNRDMDESINANLNANTNIMTHEQITDNNLHEDNDDDDDDDDDEVDENDDDDNNDDELHQDNDDVPDDEVMVSKTNEDDIPENEINNCEKVNNEICEQLMENIVDEKKTRVEGQADMPQDVVDEAGPVHYDESPPSPQANKPLQHALIHEADNVAESEDSEDEWNYYRVDPNKEKNSETNPVNEPEKTRNVEEESEISESENQPVEDTETKIQSGNVEEDIKCEDLKEESPELINIEISAEDKEEKLEKTEEPSRNEEEDKLKDMDFQLNPNAAEFIPVSPQFMGTRMDLVEDFPVSGSPFKQVPQMDDIQVPSQSEFEKEVCQRPREVDNEEKEYQNGDNLQHTDYSTDFLADGKQKGGAAPVSGNMDDSEISSTKAEFGDESSVSFLTASEFHRTGISAIDESFSSCEREYDIAKDPMAMSFTPSDFEAAFDKGVDLNAVHDLSNTDLEEANGILDKEEEEEEEEEEVMESPNLENDTVNDKMSNIMCNVVEKAAEKSEIRAEFVNLSSQQDYSEDTFIEHADELKADTIDFLDLQPESSNRQESQEAARYDHSPFAENYSGEFESEKEAVSVDNEQPSSIDETKPMDEASEDAVLLGNESQKEICSNDDGNTPSSLSPIPDAMESDLAVAESGEIQSSKQVRSSLHPDAPEFTPENYNFQSFGMDSDDVCQVRATTDSYQAYSTEAGSAFEIVKQDLVANIQFDEKEDEPVCTKPLVETKPDEEQHVVCARPLQTHSELTPPLSPQEEKRIHDIIYPVKSCVEEEVVESKEIPEEGKTIEDKMEEMMESMKESMETNVSTEEIKSVELEEPMKESILNLSDSMQEFTGLESQLQPTEEEVFKAKIVEDLQEEIIKKEELIDVTEPEKSPEIAVESEYMIQEQKEVQEFPEVKENKEMEIEQLKLKEPEEQMEIQEPEFKEFEVKEPEIKEPEIKEPEIKEPEIKEPELKEPELKEPEIKEPEMKESEIKEPEIKESEIKEPEIQEQKIKEIELEIKESEIKESEIKKSEIEELEIKEPEIKEPEIKEPEIKEPEIKEPEIKEPEIKEPEIKESEIKEIEVSSQKPEIKELLKEPEIKETEIKEPEIEKVAEVSENKVVETAAIASATAAVVAGAAGAVAAQSKAKTKALGTKPTKTTTSKPTPTRSTPTSPSKTVSSTTRTSTAAAMKKPSTTTPSRPKDLDASKKSTISSTTTSKSSVAKSASKTTTSTTATKSTSKTSVSTTSKPKPVASTASKPITVTDKKPTANGDVKSSNKSATATKSSSKASPLATKTTLVKTSSTRASTGTTTAPKVRSSSANKLNTTAKASSTTTSTTASNRPKTAPSSGTASKPRMSLNKLPAIDKQVKETANKQISMGRTSTPASKTTSRLSMTSSSTTTIKRASLTTKTTTVASPTKKSTPVSKTSKTSLSGKTGGDKGKILQNGVSENVEINTIIDDMPKKDLSPVVTPNDNQLIMSSD
ncbi:titin [Apis mellifera caucasica]|nr:titin [Apis mellifera caucasica]